MSWDTKEPDAVIDYSWNWTKSLAADEVITEAEGRARRVQR